MDKAPVGGIVSEVNGNFYEGGQFLPDHGLFCGKKGLRLKREWDQWSRVGRSIDLGGKYLFLVTTYEGDGRHTIQGYALAASEREAVDALSFVSKKCLEAQRLK